MKQDCRPCTSASLMVLVVLCSNMQMSDGRMLTLGVTCSFAATVQLGGVCSIHRAHCGIQPSKMTAFMCDENLSLWRGGKEKASVACVVLSVAVCVLFVFVCWPRTCEANFHSVTYGLLYARSWDQWLSLSDIKGVCCFDMCLCLVYS